MSMPTASPTRSVVWVFWRETICTLRPEAFGEVAERERTILGIVGQGAA